MNRNVYISFIASLLVMVLGSLPTIGQIRNMQYMNGTLAKQNLYINIEGNPYLYKEWEEGRIVFTNGTVEESVNMKYDQVNDQLLVKVDNEEWTLTTPIKEFNFYGTSVFFLNGFNSFRDFNNQTFYQILFNGSTIKFLKKNAKRISERKEYGSASINKIVQDQILFFIARDRILSEIKLNKKSILNTLDDNKTNNLEQYIKSERLKLNNEDDIIKLLTFYNTL